ncbi:CAP domain-containing protein [Leptodontidium sp. MPI-SDFR-AT-0119]|nr:CAP domain-containing protein [Leptodontidium sp. MPI-SDFR-AT-0119]
MASISRGAQKALDLHNEARRAAPGARPDLVWSKSLEATAEQYARKLIKNKRGLVHDPELPKLRNGENLAQQTGGCLSLAESTTLWLDVKRCYHGEPLSPTGADGYGNVYGHYTQAISFHATKVGIACAKAGRRHM